MLSEVIRSILVFAHLIFFSGAFALVVWGDISILKDGVSTKVLNLVTRGVVKCLLLLWLTGLLIVGIDTNFDIAMIISNSKLCLKFICVIVLTLNGVVLHLVGLRILLKIEILTRFESVVLCLVGAISTTNWCLAGFIGSANFLTQFQLKPLLASYVGILALACLCAYMVSKPVQRRLNWNRARVALAELGLTPTLRADHGPKLFR